MADAPQKKNKPDEPTGPSPDGWAAWGKTDSSPLKPVAEKPTEAPETDATGN